MTEVAEARSLKAVSPTGTSAHSKNERAPRRVMENRLVSSSVSFVLLVVLLVLAEIAADREWASRFILPAPTDVWSAFVDGVSSGVYWQHIRSTVGAMGMGFVFGATIATGSAALLVSVPFLERVFMPFIVAFQSLPKLAVAPVLILAFGFGQTSKIVIVILVLFFPVFLPTLQGLKVRDRELYELFKSLGASRWQELWHLRIPAATPYIFAGLHIGLVFALLGTVVAEFVGSRSGLGYYLLQQKAVFNVPGVFGVLMVLMIIGVTTNQLMAWVERHVAFWASDVSNVHI